MCYFLFLASPLTLSEVRSMLPEGMTADLATKSGKEAFLDLHPEAQTVMRIMRGACSCDLAVERNPDPRVDEVHLRERYRDRNLSRDHTIRALDRHRKGHQRRQKSLAHWTAALAGFVLEHARNAGPSLYYLQFSADEDLRLREGLEVIVRSVAKVRSNPGEWLAENELILVTP